jgi:hypothetical protein
LPHAASTITTNTTDTDNAGRRTSTRVRTVASGRSVATMSFVAINAITVPEGAGDELAKRFGARAGQVDKLTFTVEQRTSPQ